MHAGLVTNLVEAPAQLAVLAASGALAQPPSHEAQCRTCGRDFMTRGTGSHCSTCWKLHHALYGDRAGIALCHQLTLQFLARQRASDCLVLSGRLE